MTTEPRLLKGIAALIGRCTPQSFGEAAALIHHYSQRRDYSAWFHSSLDELVEIWLDAYADSSKGWPSVSNRSLAIMVRLRDPARRPAPRGPSLPVSKLGDPGTPIDEGDTAELLDFIDTEDGLREWIRYGRFSVNGQLPVLPLITLDTAKIYGSAVAPMYRERRIQRTWAPAGWQPDVALIEDYLLLLAALRTGGLARSAWSSTLMRVRPYVRSLTNRDIYRVAQRVAGDLRDWRLVTLPDAERLVPTNRGYSVVRESLLPLWKSASQVY